VEAEEKEKIKDDAVEKAKEQEEDVHVHNSASVPYTCSGKSNTKAGAASTPMVKIRGASKSPNRSSSSNHHDQQGNGKNASSKRQENKAAAADTPPRSPQRQYDGDVSFIS
jgi:hypothetical protein